MTHSPREYVDLCLPLPPEDPSLSLRATGAFTIYLYQYDSNKCFSSTYKFQALAAQQRIPAQSADHKDVIMQLKGMACHPIKLEINVVGGGAEDIREKNLACLQCLKDEETG